MICSPYRLTLDPDGTPIVLVDWGDLVDIPELPGWEQDGRRLAFLEANESLPVADGGVSEQWSAMVRKRYPSPAELVQAWADFTGALPVRATAALSLRVVDLTAPADGTEAERTALEMRWETCAILNVPNPRIDYDFLEMRFEMELAGRSIVS